MRPDYRLILLLPALALAGCSHAPATPTEPLGRTSVAVDGQPLDVLPQTIPHTCRPPVYPQAMSEAGIQGRVLIEFVLDTLGAVEPNSMRVIQSADRGLEASAMASLVTCRFIPGRRAGRAVRTRNRIPMNYQIG